MSFEVRIRDLANRLLAKVHMDAVPAVGEILAVKKLGNDYPTAFIVRRREWLVEDYVGFNNKKYDVTVVDLLVE